MQEDPRLRNSLDERQPLMEEEIRSNNNDKNPHLNLYAITKRTDD